MSSSKNLTTPLRLQRIEDKLLVLGDILAEVKKTNGRVTNLEAWRENHKIYTDEKKLEMLAVVADVKRLHDVALKESGKREVRMYAVSLLLGIVCSVFTAVVVYYIFKVPA